jgi:GMP synthase (glutamine-hydrolysing)
VQNAVAIRHVAFEDAGSLEDVLAARGIAIRYLDAGVDDLALAKSADLLIVLGGPIGVYEVSRYPFLRQEFAAIEGALRRGVPVLGICLGAQAIAAVLGSRVYPGREKEIGFGLIGLTPEGRASPLNALSESKFWVLHWHGDTFDLPSGATRLAETAITPNQAFAYGPKVLALQFHVELPPRDMEKWLIGHTAELARAGIEPGTLRAENARHGPIVERAGMKMFNDWLDRVGAVRQKADAK